MLKTVEEAKHIWCPYARVPGLVEIKGDDGSEDAAATGNRNGDGSTHSSAMCVSNGCMFWRWAAAQTRGSNPKGYCGAAGAPVGDV